MYRMHSLKFLQRDKIAEKLNNVIKIVPWNDQNPLHSKRQSTNFIPIDIKDL